MNRWNIDTNFRVIHSVDTKSHPYPEYTLTVVDTEKQFEEIEKHLSKSDFAEAKQIIRRVK